MNATKILSLSYLDNSRHTRAQRSLDWLSSDFQVVSIDRQAIPSLFEEPKSAPKRFTSGASVRMKDSVRNALLAGTANLLTPGIAYHHFHPVVTAIRGRVAEVGAVDGVFCHGVEPLPLARSEFPGTPIILDLHDYPPSHLEPGTAAFIGFQRLRRWTYFSHVGDGTSILVFVPSQSMKNRVLADFPNLNVAVIINAPEALPRRPKTHEAERIDLVHHGTPVKSRGIAEMLEALAQLPARYHLTFLFDYPARKGFWRLVDRLDLAHRVDVAPPVPPNGLVEAVSNFDIELIWTLPTNVNNQMMLGGKFFEAIFAGLAIVCSPTLELSSIVRRQRVGVVGENFSPAALAAAVLSLEPKQLTTCKQNSYNYAQRLAASPTRDKFLGSIGAFLEPIS